MSTAIKEVKVHVVSVASRSATLYLYQPLNTLPANQYEVTLYCKDEDTKKMVFNDKQLITVEGLDGNCKYFVGVVARNTHSDMSSAPVQAANFTTYIKGTIEIVLT